MDLALSQDAARTLAASKAATVGGSDNRNLYLVKLAERETQKTCVAELMTCNKPLDAPLLPTVTHVDRQLSLKAFYNSL